MTKNKILAVVTFSLASLSASAIAEQTMPAAKKYKWHHPWFKRDIVSDQPPSWPYKIIEEKNGVILVEVTPPGSQKESVPPASEGAKERETEQAEAARQREAEMSEGVRIALEKAKRNIALNKKIDKVKSSKDNNVQFMISIIDEFMEYDNFASSTARRNLAIQINNLLSTKTKLNSYSVASCYEQSKDTLLKWMDSIIKSYYAFLAEDELLSVQYRSTANEVLESFFLNLPDSCNQQDKHPDTDSGVWYQGGTLHKATGYEWQKASQSNRLATAGDFAAVVIKGKFNSMDQLKIYANELAICITKATEDGVGNDKQVAEIAAACAIIMGWNKL